MSRAQADPRAVTAAGYTPRPQSPPLGRPSVVDGAGTLLRAARPRQWLKNVLVFAAPTASGAIVHSGPLARTIAAFWIFVAGVLTLIDLGT